MSRLIMDWFYLRKIQFVEVLPAIQLFWHTEMKLKLTSDYSLSLCLI